MVLAAFFGYEPYPEFNASKTRFPQDTFTGRYLHYLDIVDPRTLLTSNKQLTECVDLLERHAQGNNTGATNKQLWQAQKRKQAIIHPDTGERIFAPFRMSGYVPFGWPMVTGMLLPNPGMPALIFWQWINQSHNACVNYANRNATKPNPTSRFVISYLGAVSTAVGISLGLTLLNKRAHRFGPAAKLILQRFIPLPAVATASSCNGFLMRVHEIGEGIEVYNKNKDVVGVSRIAAKRAVRDTVQTRACLASMCLAFPAVLIPLAERLKFVKRRPRLHLPVSAVICTVSFAFALPIALALFSQESTIKTADLEKEISSKIQDEHVFYNKGL